MFLKKLEVVNFRLFKELKFKFETDIIVLVGDNAQGKSSFLESIYFLATSKSPRIDQDLELVSKDSDSLRVYGEVEKNQESVDQSLESRIKSPEKVKLEINMQLNESKLLKRTRINGLPKRVSDYSANFSVVLFSPEDINLVIGTPQKRRYFIDQTLSQIDKNYKKTLSLYENILTRKNKVLKNIREGIAQESELGYWIDQQLLLGEVLTRVRSEFFDYINTYKDSRPFIYKYQENVLTKERLKSYLPKEIASATSLIGPQRDDFLFLEGERDLGIFGSRGEQRTAVLDLKIAELDFIQSKLGERPVLLLDDIFSELDQTHRAHVVNISKMQQTIIATVEWDEYLIDSFKDAQIYEVKNGNLTKN